MIEEIRELGENLIQRDGKGKLSIIVESPRVDYVLSIVLKNSNTSEYEYQEINLEQFDESKIEKYLYRFGSSNGLNVTPSAVITDSGEYTFKSKILNWFSDKNLKYNLGPHDLKKVKTCLETNQTKIINDINDKVSNLSKKDKKLLTLKFIEENDTKYIGDLDIFKKILESEAIKNYYIKYNSSSVGKNAVCSLCLNKVNEVYGFTSDIFYFYSLDKSGFAPELNRENGWKLYPVCEDCALKLEAGKRYIEEKQNNLNFYGGVRYYIIPKFILAQSSKINDLFLNYFEEYAKDPSFSEKSRDWIGYLVGREDRILELLSENGDVLLLSFLFYERPNKKEFKILMYLEDIPPSRIQTLYKVKGELDNVELFQKANLKFNFEIMYSIFLDSKNGTYEKYYLSTIEKIFMFQKVDYHFILNHLIKRIQETFIKNISTKDLTLKGLMLLSYLYKLGILSDFGDEKNMSKDIIKDSLGINNGIYSEISEKIFNEFKEFFDQDIKKAIFLEGVLTQKLLNIQLSDRGSKPFIKKLNGLKLDKYKIKSLLPDVQGKLEDYGKNYYKDLETLIAKYFVASGDKWALSNDEISFYFVLGINLADSFKSKETNEGSAKNE